MQQDKMGDEYHRKARDLNRVIVKSTKNPKQVKEKLVRKKYNNVTLQEAKESLEPNFGRKIVGLKGLCTLVSNGLEICSKLRLFGIENLCSSNSISLCIDPKASYRSLIYSSSYDIILNALSWELQSRQHKNIFVIFLGES